MSRFITLSEDPQLVAYQDFTAEGVQPPYITGVNYSNPIAQGMSLCAVPGLDFYSLPVYKRRIFRVPGKMGQGLQYVDTNNNTGTLCQLLTNPFTEGYTTIMVMADHDPYSGGLYSMLLGTNTIGGREPIMLRMNNVFLQAYTHNTPSSAASINTNIIPINTPTVYTGYWGPIDQSVSITATVAPNNMAEITSTSTATLCNSRTGASTIYYIGAYTGTDGTAKQNITRMWYKTPMYWLCIWNRWLSKAERYSVARDMYQLVRFNEEALYSPLTAAQIAEYRRRSMLFFIG